MNFIKPTAKFFLLLSFLFAGNLIWAQNSADPLTGIWLGELDVRGFQLRMVFNLDNNAGELSGTMDSPDQQIKGLEIEGARLSGDSVYLPIPKVGGAFEGIYIGAEDKLVGEWKQGKDPLPITLSRVDSVPERARPQEPKPPYPYLVEEVTYPNKAAGFDLAGTLTLPEGNGPFPAAILITGSGPQDRDETILGHKPFWVLADYLTRHGIAVLRYDDRGFGKSGGKYATSAMPEFADDVEAGMEFLKTRKEIDPAKIGLIGHSEGGCTGPMVATRRDDVDFLVMLAGLGIDGQSLLIEQAQLISAAEGMSADGLKKVREYQEGALPLLTKDWDAPKLKKKLRKFNAKFLKSISPEMQEETGFSEETLENNVRIMIAPAYRAIVSYDPEPYLTAVKCPVLAVNGTNDLQVPYRQNLEGIEKYLTAGGNEDFMIREIPQLNHLFQTSETGSISEYMSIEETFSPTALRLVKDWIVEKTK